MELEVKVVNILDVQAHGNADNLEIALIHGYKCVIRKNTFRAGDPAVYLPETSVLPRSTLEAMDLWDHQQNKGKLAGTQGNRIHPIQLRGVVSQGLLAPVPPGLHPGDDAAEYYGITKWIPEIPEHMNGVVTNIDMRRPEYDVDDILRWPDVLQEGETVVYTEKLHGTLASYTCVPGLNHPDLYQGNTIISCKDLRQHTCFKYSQENEGNLYVNTFKRKLINTGAWEQIDRMSAEWNEPITLFGEMFGAGVQDLHYGQAKNDKGFRIFDVHAGDPSEGRYLESQELLELCEELNLLTVPVLYTGPHWPQLLNKLTQGRDNISGANILEGTVITTSPERKHPELGRVKLKNINPAYHFRKGNRTDYH